MIDEHAEAAAKGTRHHAIDTQAAAAGTFVFDAEALASYSAAGACQLASTDDGQTYHAAWVPAGQSSYTSAPEDVPIQGEFRILYRDDAVVVVEKPAFLPTENTATIKDSVRQRIEQMLVQEQRSTEAAPEVTSSHTTTSGGGDSSGSSSSGSGSGGGGGGRRSSGGGSSGSSSSSTTTTTTSVATAAHPSGATPPPPPAQPTERLVFLPHRLDWETSGLLVLGLSAAAMRSLSSQFATRTIHKVYVADVIGRPPARSGRVDLPLSPDPERRPRQRIDRNPSSGKQSRTWWEVAAEAGGASGASGGASGASGGARPGDCADKEQQAGAMASRVRLTPESGRRHQLRMHCLALQCPIAGDGLYLQPTAAAAAAAAAQADGPPPAADAAAMEAASAAAATAAGQAPRLHLHAAELTFTHPTSGERMIFQSEAPFALEDATACAAAVSAASRCPVEARCPDVAKRCPESDPARLVVVDVSG